MEKKCTKCGKLKDISEFHQALKEKDGYFPWCKDCRADYDKNRMKELQRKAKAYDNLMKDGKLNVKD